MKKLLLMLGVALLVFSCSKDNVTTETTTADLTHMTPNKALDNSSEGLYVGVIGHNQNQDIHGKIFINAGNDENYTAKIELINGEELYFRAEQGGSNIHFIGDRGSFDFNIVNFSQPTASNVVIDNVSEAYIVAVKATRGDVPFVILGTYFQNGNEGGFFGNYDLIGDGFTQPTSPVSGIGNFQNIMLVSISHLGTQAPRVDNIFDNPVACSQNVVPALLEDVDLDGNAESVFAYTQTSPFKGPDVAWNLFYYPTLFPGAYLDDVCQPSLTSGDWSWRNRTGTIFVGPPPPTVTTNSTQVRTSSSLPLTK